GAARRPRHARCRARARARRAGWPYRPSARRDDGGRVAVLLEAAGGPRPELRADDRPDAGHRRQRDRRARSAAARRRHGRADDLHRRRSRGCGARRTTSSERRHLHTSGRPQAERAKVHRPRIGRLRRSAVRHRVGAGDRRLGRARPARSRFPRMLNRPEWSSRLMTKTGLADRRTQAREPSERWQSALTAIAPNKILIRGYPVDEMMGRLGFAEAVYLLLMGELPPPAIGRMLNAVLVSSLDHGVTPPSTLAARNVATSGAPLKDCVAAGILAFGPHHAGDIESCMLFLDKGLSEIRTGKSPHDAAISIVQEYVATKEVPPGFGHRLHARDPRAARLFQMALELELEGEHVRLIRACERVLEAHVD